MASIIGNRYQLGDPLGRGGMGTVYLGTDTETNTTVAIKRLHPDLANDEQIARFQREGASLRDLDHPNIVKMLDAFQDEGNYYLVMEYVAGGDLKQMIQAGDLGQERIVRMGIDLADALTRAHKLGIIHRDLKPANVLIANDGTLRLTDFGIAHVRHQATISDPNAVVGTIDYLSPEAISDAEVSESMDIWAFGVMLFQMLTGKNPFSRENITLTIVAITHDNVPDLLQLVPDISPELEDLVYRMLERDSHARISSVRYVGAILEDIQQGRTSTKPHYTTRFQTTDTLDLTTKHNLPEQITEFVGREAEIQELQRLLAMSSTRLLTILAPGGMGKTRLSLEVARQTLSDYDDGVYFVELAPLSDADAILPAIAEAVNFPLDTVRGNKEEAMLAHLRPLNSLLIFDNYEHLLEGAELVGKILATAPSIQVIVTSRQRLQQTGETLFHLSGMDFPDWETPEDAAHYAAVKLFMGSALRARSDFELTTDNLPYIARICRLVQGMPLGIVLAAAWVSVLEPQEIASEINQSIDFLEAEAGDMPSRQQSIRVVMDYAWQMISEADRQGFMGLSVFVGGFSRDAAQAITGVGIRQLMKFVNLSLLRRDADTGRYTIHELLRQYSVEKLVASADIDTIRQKHMRYYADLLTDNYQALIDGRASALQLLNTEFENVKVGWLQAFKLDDSALVNQYLACVRFWIPMSNRQREMRELIVQSYQQYHQREDIPDHHKGNIYTVYACAIAFDLHDYEGAIQAFDEGIAFLEKADATIDLLDTLYFKSVMKRIQGDFSAILELNQRAYDLAESIDQPSLMARSAIAIALSVGTLNQDTKQSLDWYEKAYQLGKKANNRSIVAIVSNNLGSNHLMLGNYDKARTYLEAAQEYNTAPLRPALLVIINRNLAELDIRDGNLGQAEERYLESVRVTDAYRKYDDQIIAHYVLAGFYYAIARYDDLYETMAKLRTIADNNITSEQTYQTIDAFEAMAKIGQSNWDAIPTIEQAVTNLAKLSDPNFYVNLLGAWVAVLIHQEDYQRALEILGFIRSLPFWSETMENTPVIQSSLTTLRAHFSTDDYERISSSWQDKKYVDVVENLANSGVD